MYLTKLASLHRLTPESSLLINGLSGAVDLVDNELRTQLLELALGGRPALAEARASALIERGYLFADEGAERAALQTVYQAYQRLMSSRPLQFVLCPTYQCNLSCQYCFEDHQLRARRETLTAQQVKNAFHAVRELSSAAPGRAAQVVLFGGEPLLPTTMEAVEAALDHAETHGIPVQVVTNGTHVRDFVAAFRGHPDVVRGAQITLDGPRAVHDARRPHVGGDGSFDEVVDGVEACFEEGIEVSLRVNLDAHNIGQLEALADLLVETGWPARDGFRCQLAPVTDHVGTSDYPYLMREDELVAPVLELWRRRPDLKRVLDFRLFRILHHLISVIEPEARAKAMPRFHYCEADRGDIYSFGPDGLIYICTESIGDPQNAVGTYSPRYEIWGKRRLQWQGRSVLTLPECQECNIATFCGGGCAYAALRQLGSPAHGLCAGAPDVVRAYVSMLRERWPLDLPTEAAQQGASTGTMVC